MKTRKLGYSDLNLTTVGLGTWAIGGAWQFGWGPQDDLNSLDAIREAMDIGINWIDTAPIYGCGHSEEVVGWAMKKIGIKPLIATKCGLLWDSERRKCNCLRAQSIQKECEDSLKRLGVDVIDLYQVHWPEPEEELEEAWDMMAQLVQQGKVRYLGVSNFSIEQMEKVTKIHPIASLQPPYSMLHRQIENGIIDYCKDNNIGIVAYSPLQRGLLTGKFTNDYLQKLPADDHRHSNPDFQEPGFSATLKMVEEMKHIAERYGKNMAQLAIAWILRNEPVTAAIVGARRAGQIVETAPGGDWELTEDIIEQVNELIAYRDKLLER